MKDTIKDQLLKREYKTPSNFVSGLNKFLADLISAPYKCQYEILDDISKEEGSCFILFNHLSRFDHLFIKKITWPKKYNTIVAYNEFFRSGQDMLFKMGNIIPKRNFVLDKTAMKAVTHVIKQGGSICFAPEGMTPMDGKNHPVVPGTGKFLKFYNIPVYQVELRGQFLIASKVCLDARIGGKCYATLRKLYSPEDLQKMTGEEIDDDLNNRMRHDEYQWQKTHHDKRNMKGQSCKNLEDLLFMCPNCKNYFTMKSEADHIFCTDCGNGTYWDDYYDFKPFEGSTIPGDPSKWCDMERVDIIKAIRADENYSFSIKVKLGKLPDYEPCKSSETSIPCGEGVVTIDHDGFHFKGIKDGQDFEFTRSYEKIYTILTPLDFKYFTTYNGLDYYDFFPVAGEEGKVGYIQLLVEEMHRFHVNYLKNFPWNQWMYE